MIDDKLKHDINKSYQTGRNSIQDLARINRVTVDEVMEIIGEGSLNVELQGDLIDPSEAGPGAQIKPSELIPTTYSTD